MAEKGAYAQAGVNIAAAQRATDLMKTAVQATFGPEVLSDVGNFGGLYDAAVLQQLEQPVLVASTDGVGTKTKVAAALNQWDSIGYDIVHHCLNDILVQGARPLFFLDYVATAHLDAEQIARIVTGVANACRESGCALLGGETAEMPGVYEPGAIDLVGTIVGVVERKRLIDGRHIQPGDVILGLPSSGLHTNGYSLARRVLADLNWHDPHPDLDGRSVGQALLAPHLSYRPQVEKLWQAAVAIRGLAHITGGGLVDNPPRIFPEGVTAVLHYDRWPKPPIFNLIQETGKISLAEMVHVFNMGLGMLVIIPPGHLPQAQQALGDKLLVVGEMVAGDGPVTIQSE
jgi:phosphoribosylformylglycinamidine cyclo-ligase